MLVNALRPGGPQTELARTYLLGGETPAKVLLPDVLVSFSRIMTNPRIFQAPLSLKQARAAMEDLLDLPGVVLGNCSSKRLSLMWRLIHEYDIQGDEVVDAYLIAGAWDLGAQFLTFDRRLGRISGELVTVI